MLRFGMRAAHRCVAASVCAIALAAITTVAPSHGTGLEPTTPLEPVSAANPPLLLDDGDAASLRHAITQSLTWLRGQPQEQHLYFGTRVVSVAEQMWLLRRMLDLLSDDPSADVLEARVNAEFELVKSVGDKGRMIVTGYHEPIIDAAESKSAEYYVPIYGV